MKEQEKQESIEELAEGKKLCMRMLNHSTSPGCKKFWADTVNHIDRKIGDLLRKKRVQSKMRRLFLMVVIVNVLVLGSILLQGCQTFKGAMNDTAWILQTTADNIQPQEK